MKGDLLDRWLAGVLATPGLTALKDPAEARRVLLDDALAGLELVRRYEGPIVDVGSGGGTPGIPLAASLPEREVTLLEAERRKTEFLERWTMSCRTCASSGAAPRSKPTDCYGSRSRRRLRPPPVAAEWCLPLVREGGAVVLWVGPSADADAVAAVAGEARRRAGAVPAGIPRVPEDGTDAARLPAPTRRREEAAARLSAK